MNDPRVELKELRTLIGELLESERDLNDCIGASVARGELPLEYRTQRAQIRETLEDAFLAATFLENSVRALTAASPNE